MEKLISGIQEVKTWSDSTDFVSKHGANYRKLLKGLTEADWQNVQKLLMVLVEKGSHKLLEEFGNKTLETKNAMNWKKHPEVIEGILSLMIEKGKEEWLEDDEDAGTFRPEYYGFMEKVNNVIKKNKLQARFNETYMQMLEISLETPEDNALSTPVVEILSDIQWQLDDMKKILDKISSLVEEEPELSRRTMTYTTVQMSLCFIFRAINYPGGGGKVKIAGKNTDKSAGKADLLKEIQPEVLKMFEFCREQDTADIEDPSDHNLSGEILKNILEDYLYMNKEKTDILKPFMPGIKELWDCDDEILQRDANNIMTAIGGNFELLGDDTADTLIDQYFDGEQPMLITEFQAMYPSCPDKFNHRVSDFIEVCKGADQWVTLTTLNLLWEISKSSPESFSNDDIKFMVDTLKIKDIAALGFMAIGTLADKVPEKVTKYDKEIIAAIKSNPVISAQGGSVLVSLSKTSEEKAKLYLKVLAGVMKSVQPLYRISLLSSMRSIAAINPALLEPHRKMLEDMRDDPTTADMAQATLDTLEGRTLEKISAEVTEQREDIDDLDERVANTEENVDNLGKEVDATKKDVKDIRKDVDEQGERLDDLEEVVEETVEKVEEIDHKTLSHAPAWSKEVSKLLNPKAEHDWRLLASRLGYTNDDIRNWATQPDPCLSLLDEWFATHKTREATYAVSKILEEMNRLDAAAIVVQALEDSKDIVEDDDEDDFVDPPPVFISYQWGHQQEVKMLQKHLQMAGFDSWMDIGQMGGGDKLYAKIDQGIRAAQVVIACISEKYAKSPNCNREVNLSVTLGKPIIPLLMEQMPWPPAGTMGPIFSEYLYIGFHATEDETPDDERFWPAEKFQELLMQLRFTVAPDHKLITDVYKDWWAPPEEVIVIKPKVKEESNATAVATTEKKEEDESAEVFISYQWGKQPQLKALYQKLTSMGFNCWLDIMQMGGGDSLYDKIDRGVRGAKVVLSCVTSKYSLSANCRREVSLADALKKPIIPLLLENITWPPEGPMSMVFTQLLYVDFCKPDASVQNHWNIDEFDQLLEKIKIHLPKDDEVAMTEATESSKPVPKIEENHQKEKKNGASGNNNSVQEKQHERIEPKPTPTKPAQNSPPVVTQQQSSCCSIQ